MKRFKTYPRMIFLFLLLILLSVGDLVMDLFSGSSFTHLILDAGIVILALYFIREWHAACVNERHTNELLQQYVDGLKQTIEAEFERWHLTEAEKRIAIMLIKGKSIKEIAEYCHRGEGTVRQHSVSVYRKAGFHGRAELAAYFLNELLKPDADQENNK
ncbi:MAG: helix-turn-helix transcriptional regulator [Thiomicrospira sp.]|uniref:helix-turn-helix transcriptional regulator n=1 Tax=Thiomicrospira sp. TaxID=935 RepID=UPI001A01EEFF|nr:helix-turn-helix transcriptional regulator [Thiomicrospira sp.]MBE0493703.1 helix-turn-helix transcriptional regulator [Thiomicrospira sp.]